VSEQSPSAPQSRSLRLALFGYGKMGQMIEEAASRASHNVVCVVDPQQAIARGRLQDADVCLDFTEPGAVIDNLRTVAKAGRAMVIGTTGWYDRMDEARSIVESSGIGAVYGSNFSIGVNLMFKLVQQAAALFARFEGYDPFIEEAHHKFKKDAPSGTAITLKRIVDEQYGRQTPVTSTRAGYIPGTHVVGFDSTADTLQVTHRARDRSGFADGAIVAAQWIRGRTGLYDFSLVIDERLRDGAR
jgi:4-hydroxy-tetrahydrodipicolinate reductase